MEYFLSENRFKNALKALKLRISGKQLLKIKTVAFVR